MEEHAKRLVREFVEDVLTGETERFRNFNFQTLRNSEKYGCPGRNFDCDDTNIMRAVYVVLWGKYFPFLSMNNFGYRRQYRGDTINTFHTFFGREFPERPGYFAGLEKYSPSDEIREKVRHFGTICSRLGNYVVLPNYFACQTSLNCYRGTNEWHDFFDRFLIALYQVLTKSEHSDSTLKELAAVNQFCFQHFYEKEGFRRFKDLLLLDDYCGPDGMPKQVFNMNYHWMKEDDPEQYFHDAELYLEKAEQIIEKRTDAMIRLLTDHLKD